MADGAEPTAEQLAELLRQMPFAVFLGMRLTEAIAARVIVTLPWSRQRCTAGGMLHGGVLMSLADTAGAVCAFLNLPPGTSTSTIGSTTNMFRAVRTGLVTATAHPLHVGRSVITVQTHLRDEDGRVVAQTTQSQAVLAVSS